MKKILIFICLATLLSCGHKNQIKNASLTKDITVTETEDATLTDTIVS